MNDVAKCFSENIRLMRRRLGMTQKELSERLGYSEKAVSKWESGNGMPPITMLPDIAKELKTTIEELFEESSEICYFLGIDGGGTKTEFLLADGEGNRINRILLGSCNPNDVGIAKALEVIDSGIIEVCGELPRRKISVFAGIAGSSTGEHKHRLLVHLEKYRFASASVDSDAKNALSAALDGSDGIAVIMGTGSLAFAQVNGESYRVGGYGYLLGDGGSGFAIGRDTINAALAYEDGYGACTVLIDKVREKCGTKTVWESISELYKGGKRLIASFAPLAFDAYKEGDAVGIEIINKNMKEIVTLILGAAQRFSDLEEIPVVLCGGLTVNDDILIPLISELLQKATKQKFNITVCRRSMAQGALTLAGLIIKEDKENACNRNEK